MKTTAKRWGWGAVFACLCLFACSGKVGARAHPKPLRTLTLVHASDMESELLPIGDRGGIARFQALAQALAAGSPHDTLLVAAGDIFMPGPALPVRIGEERAVTLANGAVGWDATTLGNHEFDRGDAFLAEMIAASPFAFLTATVDFSKGPLTPLVVPVEAGETPWIGDHPGRILSRGKHCVGALGPGGCDGYVIGLVGATTERLGTVASVVPKAKSLPDLPAVIEALQREVDALEREGIDIVVLLSHLQGVHRELELIEGGLRGVDVIVAGGGDDRLANEGHRLHGGDEPAPICADLPGSCYPLVVEAEDGAAVVVVATDGQHSYVGRVGVSFDEAGRLHEVDPASRPWPVDDTSLSELGVSPQPAALAIEEEVELALSPTLGIVGVTRHPLNGEREEVRNRETNLGSATADSLVHQARAAGEDVAFGLRNAGGIRASICAEGPFPCEVSLYDVQRSLRFDDALVVVTTTHATLRETLEAALRGVGTARGAFPQLSGEALLVYDASEDEQVQRGTDGGRGEVVRPGARVRRFVLEGEAGPIEIVRDGEVPTPGALVTLVTLEYLTRGGDGYFPGHGALDVSPLERDGAPLREQAALLSFLSSPTWEEGRGYEDPAEGATERIREATAADQ